MELAEFHYQVLDYIERHRYTSGTDLKSVFPNEVFRIERTLIFLSDKKLLLFTTASNDDVYEEHKDIEGPCMEALGFDLNWRLFLSEKGHVCLEVHRKELEELHISQQELQVAKDDSKTAKLSAFFSNGFALIAIIISILSLALQCLGK